MSFYFKKILKLFKMNKTFDINIKKLFTLSCEVHDKLYGSMANQQFWFICMCKFSVIYSQSDNQQAFIDIFLKFYKKNIEFFTQKLFVENENDELDVNDDWLLLKNKEKKTKKWSPSMSTCKGQVIYFDEQNVKLKAIIIPISELYDAAIKLYKEKGDSNPICKTYQIKVLDAFFSIFSSIVTDNDVLNTNLTELKEHIEIITPTKSTESNMGGIGKLISGVLSNAGINSNFDTKNIDNLINKASTQENLDKMSTVLKEVVTVFNTTDSTENKGVDGILNNIKKVIELPIIKSVVSDVSNIDVSQMATSSSGGDTQSEGVVVRTTDAAPEDGASEEIYNPENQE